MPKTLSFIADVSAARVIGGAERVLREHTSRLARRGHLISILTRRLPHHLSDQEKIEGVHEYRYPVESENPFRFLRTTLKNGRDLFERLHQSHPIECINFHQPFSAAGVLHSPAARPIPKFYTCHSLAFEEYISRNPKPAKPMHRLIYHTHVAFRKWLERWVMLRSDHIIVLSDYTRKKLLNIHRIPERKITLVPGGVDTDLFFPAADKAVIRKRLRIQEDRVVAFTVRNLVSRMGLENLILAIKTVAEKHPEVLLIIGGDGPLRERLWEYIRINGLQSFIRMEGFIPESALPDYYRMADFFVLPTLELEGFGLVTLEALASGIPVLGTPIGGTREILGHWFPDLLFQSAAPDAMAERIGEAVQQVRDDPFRWRQLGERCRRIVETYYSWERAVDSLETLFKERIG